MEASRDNPLLHSVVKHASLIYDEIPLREFITEEKQAELSRELYLEIFGICNAVNPVMACRDKLAATMLRFASYQVLVIPPAPEEDPSGLRGQPGISGALNEHLLRILEVSDQLRTEIYDATDARSFDAVWQAVQKLYWTSCWFLRTFDAARVELNDVAEGEDWFKYFEHAACANQEHLYRWALEIPPAFDEEIAAQASAAYSVFTDIVLSGEENPVAEWRDYHKRSNVPAPSIDF